MRENLIKLLDEAYFDYRHGNGDCDMVRNIADHIIASDIFPKWIPVTERLPEKKGSYITYNSNNRYRQTHITPFDQEDDYWRLVWENNVTHWMPLPEAPKGE